MFVTTEREPGSYVVVTLCKEPVNSMDLALWSELLNTLDDLENDPRQEGVEDIPALIVPALYPVTVVPSGQHVLMGDLNSSEHVRTKGSFCRPQAELLCHFLRS